MKPIALLLFALPAFAASAVKPADPAAPGRHPPAVVQAIDDLLEPEAPSQSGGEYDDVLASGSAAFFEAATVTGLAQPQLWQVNRRVGTGKLTFSVQKYAMTIIFR